MRYIPLPEVRRRLSRAWLDMAESARAEVDALPPEERGAAINRLSAVWGTLKPILEEVSNKKCWYCETAPERCDKPVDHFRPKLRVTGVEGSVGYWWLAFDWTNYRFSCTFCNSRRRDDETDGGKHDNFPIARGRVRGAYNAAPAALDQQEQPLLLDPTKPSDVDLLTFDVGDGSAVPAVSESEDPVKHERAVESIKLYHLHQEDLRMKRLDRMMRIEDLVNHAEKRDASYDDYVGEILSCIRFNAEHSAAARAKLMALRGRSKVARDILRLEPE